MANFSFSRLERAYLQAQPVFGTIPNTTGTATVGNSNACRFIRMELQNVVGQLERPDKTGTRSQEGFVLGRKSGRWSIEMSLAGNGTSGVVPDCDPILQAVFGNTAVIGSGNTSITSSTDALPIVLTCGSAHGIASGAFEVVTIANHTINTNANGTFLAYANDTTHLTLVGSTNTGNGAGSGGTMSRVKCSYTFTDNINQFTLWSFRTAGTLDQRVSHTCVVSEATFNLNQDVATWSANGDSVWVLRSKDYSISDQYQLGGMTGGFPSEPSSPVTNGAIVPGFVGRFTAYQSAATVTAPTFASSAVSFPTIRNATIRVQTSNQLVRDTFGSYYPTMTEGDVRNITISFNIYDDDSATVNQLKTWGDASTPVDFVINMGTVAGNIWVHYLKNVYLAAHVLGDGQLRFDASYAESRATTTNLTVKDEYALIIA